MNILPSSDTELKWSVGGVLEFDELVFGVAGLMKVEGM